MKTINGSNIQSHKREDNLSLRYSLLFHQSFHPPPPFVYCVESYPLPLIASRLMAASGTVQITGRLAIACNLLKFKVIFCSPMGTPFACCTAVTNRCNLLMMCLYYASLHSELSSKRNNLTQPFDRRVSI